MLNRPNHAVATILRFSCDNAEANAVHNILEHDLFERRASLTRETCPQSKHIDIKQSAQARPWRLVALGQVRRPRPRVFAPLRRALTSERLTSQVQAYSRSVVVDGQWPEMEKHQRGRVLRPLWQ